MPAELVAQRGDHLGAEGLLLAGAEPREQRQRDDRRRHVEAHRLLHGPAPLARVFHVAPDGGQLVVTGERPLRQLVQPGAHHAAVVPQLRDLAQVKGEILRGVQNLVALGIGLEQSVLDPIVHHLDVVAGAAGAHVGVALGRREGPKDRLAVLERGGRGTDHEAVADRQAPDPAARPDVHELDPLVLERLGPAQGVAEVRVAAVNDDVTRVRCGTSCSMVLSTGAPAGTITQTTRRGASCLATSARSFAVLTPFPAWVLTAAALESYTISSCPPWTSRST